MGYRSLLVDISKVEKMVNCGGIVGVIEEWSKGLSGGNYWLEGNGKAYNRRFFLSIWFSSHVIVIVFPSLWRSIDRQDDGYNNDKLH